MKYKRLPRGNRVDDRRLELVKFIMQSTPPPGFETRFRTKDSMRRRGRPGSVRDLPKWRPYSAPPNKR